VVRPVTLDLQHTSHQRIVTLLSPVTPFLGKGRINALGNFLCLFNSCTSLYSAVYNSNHVETEIALN
jgi:hypothetical protein